MSNPTGFQSGPSVRYEYELPDADGNIHGIVNHLETFRTEVDAALHGHAIRPSGPDWEAFRDTAAPDPEDYSTIEAYEDACEYAAYMTVRVWEEGGTGESQAR